MKIAIIGAGPRGILAAGEIASNQPKTEIHLFDPYPIGGITWQTNQSNQLVMNTPAYQIQQFASSKTLAAWAHTNAKPFIKSHPHISDDLINDLQNLTDISYPTRRLYGAYLQATYGEIPHRDHLQYHQCKVNAIQNNNDQVAITTDERTQLFDDVIITINNGDNKLNSSEQALDKYASTNDLNYIHPITNLKQVNLQAIKPHSNVIIRGLGLTFSDVVAELTQGRGGDFYRDANNQLQYQSTGKEPQIIAGSRRGLPPYPKPRNQDGPTGQVKPRFLTASNIQKRVAANAKTTKYQAFIQLLHLEVEYRYYSSLLRHHHQDVKSFQKQFIQDQRLPDSIPNEEKLNWDHIKNPVAGEKITTVENYQHTVLSWLEQITTDAQQGSKDALLSAGLNASRELRGTIKALYINPQISTDDFKVHFLNDFAGTDAFLTSGAPNFRLEQIMALLRAKILTILPPQMKVAGGNQHFLTLSMFYPKEIFKADTLIEARTPKANLMRSTNPLIQHMVKTGLLSQPQLTFNGQTLYLNGANINEHYQIIDAHHQTHHNIYLLSQLLEGKRWLTNICPRSGDDANRQALQNIIKTL